MLALLTLVGCFVGLSHVYGAPTTDYCTAIVATDCNSTPTHSIQVCGSDGTTYINDCFLKKTACLRHTSVTKVYDGACGHSIATTKPTTAAATTKPTTTMMTTKVTTTTPAPTTTVNGEEVALDIFCLDIAYIRCGTQGPTVCGSNGKYYDNMCEFDKARCTHRDIHSTGTNCQ